MTVQLLLVDDELHAIEGVKSDLNTEKLEISSLFTAYNMKQAKAVIEREHIDIMLCDIEMPQGSGLELLEWVREHYPHVITIFLTSHADFKYAKEAIQLGSLDYLLKPVKVKELERAINRAKELMNHNSEVSRNKQSHQLWMKHRALVVERFWTDIIHHTLPSHRDAIQQQAEHLQLPFTEHMLFIPILISVQRWNKEMTRRDQKIIEYALKNSAEEIIIGKQRNGLFFYIEPGIMLGIFTVEHQPSEEQIELLDSCEYYISMCNQYFYCELSCYFGVATEASGMASMVASLKQRERNNVAFFNKVFPFHIEDGGKEAIDLPDLEIWLSLLKAGTKEVLIQKVESFLQELVDSKSINANILEQFHQDFMQVLYSYLNMSGIQARRLYGDELSRSLSEQANHSVADLLIWIHHIVDKAFHQTKSVEETETVIQQVQRYVSNHLDQDLSRDMIANYVYLNPDYLSRILKRKTGFSVSNYVLNERIKRAGQLITETNIPISTIAASVGHTNFSHFASIFKKHTGLGPTEYRAQYGKV